MKRSESNTRKSGKRRQHKTIWKIYHLLEIKILYIFGNSTKKLQGYIKEPKSHPRSSGTPSRRQKAIKVTLESLAARKMDAKQAQARRHMTQTKKDKHQHQHRQRDRDKQRQRHAHVIIMMSNKLGGTTKTAEQRNRGGRPEYHRKSLNQISFSLVGTTLEIKIYELNQIPH